MNAGTSRVAARFRIGLASATIAIMSAASPLMGAEPEFPLFQLDGEMPQSAINIEPWWAEKSISLQDIVGGKIKLWAKEYAPHHGEKKVLKWKFKPQKGGGYIIQEKESALILKLGTSGGDDFIYSTYPPQPGIPPHGYAIWQVEKSDDGRIKIQLKGHEAKALGGGIADSSGFWHLALQNKTAGITWQLSNNGRKVTWVEAEDLINPKPSAPLPGYEDITMILDYVDGPRKITTKRSATKEKEQTYKRTMKHEWSVAVKAEGVVYSGEAKYDGSSEEEKGEINKETGLREDEVDVDLAVGWMQLTTMRGAFVKFEGKVSFQPHSVTSANTRTLESTFERSEFLNHYVDLVGASAVDSLGFELQDTGFRSFKKIVEFAPKTRAEK